LGAKALPFEAEGMKCFCSKPIYQQDEEEKCGYFGDDKKGYRN